MMLEKILGLAPFSTKLFVTKLLNVVVVDVISSTNVDIDSGDVADADVDVRNNEF